VTGRQGGRRKQLLDDFLLTCRKTDYEMNEDATLFFVIVIIIFIINSKMIKLVRHVISTKRKNNVLREHRNKIATFKKINK
jgi:hypothetical protein